MNWLKEVGPDGAALLVSILLVAGYYLLLWLRVRKDPTSSIHGINEIARAQWVESVMTKPGKDVMAVQTLRNFLMGASLMASTATLLIIGTLTLSGQAENIGRSWHLLNQLGSTRRDFGSSRCCACYWRSSWPFSPSPWRCGWPIRWCSW